MSRKEDLQEALGRLLLDPLDNIAAIKAIRIWRMLNVILPPNEIYQVIVSQTNQPWDSDIEIKESTTDYNHARKAFMEALEEAFDESLTERLGRNIEDFSYCGSESTHDVARVLYQCVGSYVCVRLFCVSVKNSLGVQGELKDG